MLEVFACCHTSKSTESLCQTVHVDILHNTHSFRKIMFRCLCETYATSIGVQMLSLHFLVLLVDMANVVWWPLVWIMMLHAALNDSRRTYMQMQREAECESALGSRGGGLFGLAQCGRDVLFTSTLATTSSY